MQSAENTGAGYASGEIGGVGALSTDYFANMQYINSMGNMRTDAASAQTRANDAWFKATQYQNKAYQIGALGGMLQSGLRAGASIYSTGFNGTKDYEKVGIGSNTNTTITPYDPNIGNRAFRAGQGIDW